MMPQPNNPRIMNKRSQADMCDLKISYHSYHHQDPVCTRYLYGSWGNRKLNKEDYVKRNG